MRNRSMSSLLLLSAMVAMSLGACSGGKSDRDGNKSMEGHNDPANTGGTMGGDETSAKQNMADTTSEKNK